MPRYKPPARLRSVFAFVEWFLIRAFSIVVLAVELWEYLKYLVHRSP
jgi:hypothetical protein